MSRFHAIRIDADASGQRAHYAEFDETELMDGDVTVRVTHSTINYKDGLAITGKAPVVRRFPMIPGIDFAGTVERSSHPEFKPGDQVVLNGWGCGETHFGGFAQKARVKGDWLVRLPKTFTAAQSMAIGTAGYTAALAVLALQKHGLTPDRGPILVTGAAGGVGSIAIVLLATAGWRVIASTGRKDEADFLTYLGASEIIDRAELSAPGKPLGKERWAAAVDAVGSHTLANVLAQTAYEGAVAACGNAQGMDLPATVAPFILRGVSLLGVNSVTKPKAARLEAWNLLERDLDPAKLGRLSTTIGLYRVMQTAAEILEGKVRGRVIVEIE
jgi:acrylyl-CoA reductase (NADPH)